MNFDKDYRMLIDGQLVGASQSIEVVNPATGQTFTVAPDCSLEQLDSAVAAAARAFQTWRHVPLAERQAYLRQAAEVLEANADELARLLGPARDPQAPLEWVRVHDLPDYVYFNHSIHLNKGVGCNTCHGPIDQMPCSCGMTATTRLAMNRAPPLETNREA